MSSELWQQAKEALAEVMALVDGERAAYLADLQSKSPDVHDEVVSLLSSQAEAEQKGFLADADDTEASPEETMDQYRTETYDPDRTRAYISKDDLNAAQKPKNKKLTDLVGDDYEVESKLGQGGMGVVYKAYHRSLRRTVALKVISGGGLRDEIDIARFHIEAEAAARLDHPGIIPVYDVGEHNGNHYYAMAYVEGPSLSKYVGRSAKLLAPRRSAELMEQVCLAVQYAHDRAVIHRDLKPANIMLENGEIPRLADFGLAKNMHEDDGLTMTGQVMGTPSYMAPEQATGKLDEISNRTDVYSLGATLYALLAGRPPFSGGTMLETIRQVVRSTPEPLTQVSHVVPRDLETICEKCLAKNPQDRYASAAEVAEDLRRFLDGFPISARPLAPWARLLRWCQRNPVEAALVSVTVAALLVGTFVSVRYGIEANRQAAAARVALAEAQENAKKLRESIDESIVFASEDVLAQEPGMQAARAVLLKTAQRYYAELVTQASRDAASQSAVADAQFKIAKVQMALGEDLAARQSLNDALALQQDLASKHKDDAAILEALAKTHNQLSRLAAKKWESFIRLSYQRELADAENKAADQELEGWQKHAEEVVRLRKLVAEARPADIESQLLYANSLMNQGVAHGQRAYAKRDLVGQDQARPTMLEAQKLRQELLKTHADAHDVRRDLGLGYYNMANAELSAAEQEVNNEPYFARFRQAVADLTAAIQAYELLPDDYQRIDSRERLANIYRVRAVANLSLLELESAVRDYQKAEQLLQTLVIRNPKVYRFRLTLAETSYNLSAYWFKEGQNEQGMGQFSKCRSTMIQSLRMDPTNLDAADQITQFTLDLADFFLKKKPQELELAQRVLQEAIDQLLALQQESEEYDGLKSSIEALQREAERVNKLRTKAETPESVA